MGMSSDSAACFSRSVCAVRRGGTGDMPCSSSSLSKPVATTTSSMALPSCGFSLVPQMMLALWTVPSWSSTVACIWMYSRIRTTSSYMSSSAFATEMLSRMFFAPEMRLWSSSGERSDASATGCGS